MKNYKVLMPKLLIYFLCVKITAMCIIMALDRRQIKELKNNYQERVVYAPNANLQPERYATPQTPTARK